MEQAIGMAISAFFFVIIWSLFSKSDNRKKKDALNNPNNVDDIIEMGIKSYNKNEFDDALKLFENINRSKKMDYTAIADLYRGLIYFDKNNFLQARIAFEAFKQNERYLNKKDYAETIGAINFLLGGLYFIEGRLDKAKDHKDLAVSYDNDYSITVNDRFPGYEKL